jgi:two-component system, OmpR family, sensor histidine kinase KdpD
MTRVQSGHLQLNLEWCDIGDLISVSLNRLETQLMGHKVSMEIRPDLPLIRIDFVLIEQALVNLLHNAAVYTPAATRILIAANANDTELAIVLQDHGPGFQPAVLERIFEKFLYRGP